MPDTRLQHGQAFFSAHVNGMEERSPADVQEKLVAAMG
jgi:hypothetical protein